MADHTFNITLLRGQHPAAESGRADLWAELQISQADTGKAWPSYTASWPNVPTQPVPNVPKNVPATFQAKLDELFQRISSAMSGLGYSGSQGTDGSLMWAGVDLTAAQAAQNLWAQASAELVDFGYIVSGFVGKKFKKPHIKL